MAEYSFYIALAYIQSPSLVHVLSQRGATASDPSTVVLQCYVKLPWLRLERRHSPAFVLRTMSSTLIIEKPSPLPCDPVLLRLSKLTDDLLFGLSQSLFHLVISRERGKEESEEGWLKVEVDRDVVPPRIGGMAFGHKWTGISSNG